VTATVCAVIALPMGWAVWRLAQRFIDARSLEEGDTELRLPWYSAVVLEVIIFGGLGWRFAGSPRIVLAVYLFLFAAFTALLLIDFGRYYLPNQLVLAALLVGGASVLVASLVIDQETTDWPWRFWAAALGVVLNFLIYFGFWVLAQLVFGSRGLGFGDVKLSAPLGLAIGWMTVGPTGVLRLALWALLIGFASGALSSILLLRGVKMRQSFPQGPFLVLGTFVVIVFSASFLGP
jgi:leader peptidase (prepilin peptidase) / N-methyltransferase